MLSQLNNDHHNNRIRRSKSATSVKERRKHPIASEPIDPESARLQALIAAHRAMDRSRGSSEANLYRRASSPVKHVPESSYRPESVELARKHFSNSQSSPQSLQMSPDVLYHGKRRQKKDFQSSLRSSESTEVKEIQAVKYPSTNMARSLSSSLRNRFKRAFSKPESCLPPQQLAASRAHFGDGIFSDIGNGGFDNYHTNEGHALRRDSMYDNPWYEKVEDDDLRRLATMAPLNKSNGSLSASSKSRVTSWANTTTTGSMLDTPLERKRLSVIQEDGGPHQPSSSAGSHLGGASAFRRPLPLPTGQRPDPQRLYSALVRRMNQESLDRKPVAGTEDDQPSSYVGNTQERTVRAVTSSTTAGDRPEHEVTEYNAVDDHRASADIAAAIEEAFHYNYSEESVYSKKDDGDPNPDHRQPANMSEQSIEIPDRGRDIGMYRLENKSNPYASDLKVNQPLQADDHASASMTSGSTHETSRGATHVRQKSVRNKRYSIMPNLTSNLSQASLTSEKSQGSSHVREQAQINPEQTAHVPENPTDEPATGPCGPLRKPGGSGNTSNFRTATPSDSVPDQLSVAKKRYPLLNVKEVAKNNTPVPSRPSSLTRSQSGLLQQMVNAEQGQNGKQENRLAASLRKISPQNVTNLLRGRKSLAVLGHKKHEKENRPYTTDNTPEAKIAISTSGPSYLTTRSGNSMGHMARGKDLEAHCESPTDIVKAKLSARLSRPFDMDALSFNQPSDSMYSGERESGYQDTAGGRLSVAHVQQPHNHPLGYDKRRSFDRGPGGYGGLGPSPFDSQTLVKHEEPRALPHVPTPEDQLKRKPSRAGMSLASKRMVSNFLRSRKKAVGSDEGAMSHEENVRNDVPGTSSPLFV
ncbi:hypothetical protein LTR70_000003 [Exophiala xenobiotica]|uniref:Uncharacterized protein n=1 Tax=Lithohypha guttulata TaxID=1690604 RepID=A0ABR0K5E2_9EURO|nr:hypothetical protein LTR24_006935 [Lithohypha guttulata]KAK5330681.1 hypothetical protein LTR70_000003 [Exophiala xenobiotica]